MKLKNYRTIATDDSCIWLFDEKLDQANIIVKKPDELKSISLFFQGAGEQLKLIVNSSSGRFSCVHVNSGYQRVLFDKKVEWCIGDELDIKFAPNWIQVCLGGSYIGSSYLEGENSGCLRFETELYAEDFPSRLEIVEMKPEFAALFVGDGFTGGNWPHVHYWMWPDLVYGGQQSFLNAGVSAANTRKALIVVRHLTEPNGVIYPACFLMLGVDDVIDMVDRKESEENYKTIVKMLSSKCGILYLCTLTPREDKLNAQIQSYNEYIRSYEGLDKIRIIDVEAAFEGLNLADYFFERDFPNQKGQEVIAKSVIEVVGGEISNSCKANLVCKNSLLSKLMMIISNKFRGAAGKLA